MDVTSAGDRVTVETGGPQLDGIVFEVPSSTKVVVAVMDRDRGPVLRSVASRMVSERTTDGPDDAALHLLIRRTPGTQRGAGRSGAGGVAGQPGHQRAAMHRTTGK